MWCLFYCCPLYRVYVFFNDLNKGSSHSKECCSFYDISAHFLMLRSKQELGRAWHSHCLGVIPVV